VLIPHDDFEYLEHCERGGRRSSRRAKR